VSSHKAYGIWWQAPDADWASASVDLQLIFASFRPAPAALD
jgi:eukaryotic-like serine/threonine-protein kinase